MVSKQGLKKTIAHYKLKARSVVGVKKRGRTSPLEKNVVVDKAGPLVNKSLVDKEGRISSLW
jgi:hypothetical protein